MLSFNINILHLSVWRKKGPLICDLMI